MSAHRDACMPGARDLASEQRETSMRRRLYHALVHGCGTVWGLSAAACEPDHLRLRTRILVRPGLAVDPFGQDIYVDREQCLDVGALGRHPIWREMAPPEGAQSRTVRRAYIVLRREPLLLAPVVDPRSSHAHDGLANERFRLELAAVPPPEPRELRRAKLPAAAGEALPSGAGEPFAALALGPAGGAPWSAVPGEEASVPLLLATVDLELTGQGTSEIAFAVEPTPQRPNPDNRVRAIVPGTRRVAELLFGGLPPSPRAPRSRRGVVGAGQ